MRGSSDILKKAINRNTQRIGMANIVARALLFDHFATPFQTISAIQAPTANKTSWIRDTFNGPNWKCILNHHFSIFLGTNTFMIIEIRSRYQQCRYSGMSLLQGYAFPLTTMSSPSITVSDGQSGTIGHSWIRKGGSWRLIFSNDASRPFPFVKTVVCM